MITTFASILRTALLGLCLALAVACDAADERAGLSPSSAAPHSSPGSLCGQVFSDTPLLLYPDGGWGGAPSKMRWRLTSPATMICQVNREQETALHLSLVPAGDSPLEALQLLWNGQVEPAISVLSATGRVEIGVPSELLTVGMHLLTLILPEVPVRNKQGPSEVERVEFASGSLSGILRPDQASRLKRMAGFLTSGVLDTGDGWTNRDGFFFEGPHRTQARLNLTAEAVFEVEADNRSEGEARFTVSAGRRDTQALVPAGQAESIRLRLPPGEHLLTFAVEGPADGLYWWGTPFAWPQQPSDLVPIIIITLDTTRRDVVSPYHGSDDATPVLGAFADEATVYTRAFAVSPWTLPSHASIFTGLYPSDHGAGVRWARLMPGAETLAGLLRDRGYLTAGFAGGPLCAARYGVAQGFTHYRDPGRSRNRARPLTKAVVEFLDTTGHAPLFLFVNYFDPHFPYVAPPRFRQQFRLPQLKQPLVGNPNWLDLINGDGRAFKRMQRSGLTQPEEALRCLRAAYCSEVAYMDQQLGVLFAELRRRNLYHRAFIAVLADHGEFLGEHGLFDHSYRLDPELIDIPCLIKWPGQTVPRVVDLPVSQIDLYPTILHLAGVETRPTAAVPLRHGEINGLAERPFLLMEEHLHPEVHKLGFRAIKLADHLYGMVSPVERLWAWEGGQRCSRREGERWVDQPCAGQWEENLTGLRARFVTGDFADTPLIERLDEEEAEKLRQLGYLE